MSIIAEIQRRQLRAIESSIRYSETSAAKVAAMAENAKQILNSEHKPSDADTQVHQLRVAYYKAYKEYTGKESFAFAEPMNKRSKALWTRVKEKCAAAGVDPEQYIKAQFSWFDKSFGKPPTIIQLTTDTAVERAKQYVPSKVSNKIVNGYKEVKTDFATIMRLAEQQMQSVMRAQNCTREEVYKNFVIPGFMSFPPEFLKLDPVYKKVIDE